MTLEKTLEILLLNKDQAADKMPPEVMKALCIAIECVQLVITLRLTGNELAKHLLLHETK